MLEIEYDFREKDLIFFNEVRLGKSEEIQKSYKRNRLIIPGIAILIGLYIYTYQGHLLGLYVCLIGLLWSIVSPRYIKWGLQQQILKKYTHKEKSQIFGHYRLKIEPHELVEISPSGKHKMPWGELLRVEYQKRYVFIYVELDTALIIPVDAVTKGDLEQFAEQVEKLIERHA